MKRYSVAILAAVVFCLAVSFDAFAQRGGGPGGGMMGRGGMMYGSGGWGVGTPYTRLYNSNSVESFKGLVVSVDRITPMPGMAPGVHITVRTEKETIPVHLGPAWYLDNQDVIIQPNENVEVKGSRVIFEGRPVIIAQRVEKGDEMLMLRDDNGLPLWSAWRRR